MSFYNPAFNSCDTNSMYDLLQQRRAELNAAGPAKILKLWNDFNHLFPFGGIPLESTLAYLIAYSGVGKSYCALNFFLYPMFVGLYTPTTLFFSMDMRRVGLAERYCAMITGSIFDNSRDVLRNRFDLVNQRYNQFHFDNKLRVALGRRSIEGIFNTMYDLRNRGFIPELVIFDHLQLIPGGDDEKGMHGICNALQDFVGEFNCLALVVSQVARPPDLKDKIDLSKIPPLLSQAKGSSAIDASADYAFAIAQDYDSPINYPLMSGRILMKDRKLREKSHKRPAFKSKNNEDFIYLYYTPSGILEQVGVDITTRSVIV